MNEQDLWTALFWAIIAVSVAILPVGVWVLRELVHEWRREKAETAFEPFVHEVSERLSLPDDEVAAALRGAEQARKVVLTPGP